MWFHEKFVASIRFRKKNLEKSKIVLQSKSDLMSDDSYKVGGLVD